MKKLIMAIIVLLSIVPCWATTHIMYMTPGGAGSMSGMSLANAAANFNQIVGPSWSFEPNAVIDVIMAGGTYTISENQHFDISPVGKRYVFNYGDACNINVNISGYMYFHNYSSTPAASYEFREVNFVSTNSYAAFWFDANEGEGKLANSTRIFTNCRATADVNAYMFAYAPINGAIELNNCTFTSGYQIARLGGNVTMNVNGGTYTTTTDSDNSCIELGNETATDAPVFTAHGATFKRTAGSTAAGYVIAETNPSMASLSLIDCNVWASPSSYISGIHIVSGPLQYIKHTHVSAPNQGINCHSVSTNVIIDGADAAGNMETIEANAPVRWNVSGTWVAGDTIQVFIQKGQQVSSYTYTVVSDKTSTMDLAADFTASWNNNSDSFCRTITATMSSIGEIKMNGTSAWGCAMYAIVNSANGKFTNQAASGQSPMIPGYAVALNGSNIILENYKIRNPNGQAYEGITVAGDYPVSRSRGGGNVIIRNCDIRDSFFQIAVRSYGVTVDHCVVYGCWPYYTESEANQNTCKNSTLYAIRNANPNDGYFSGCMSYGACGSGQAFNEQFYNNICVADSNLTNMGTGTILENKVYCINDEEALGANNNYFDWNCYYTIGTDANLAFCEGNTYSTLPDLLNYWTTIEANTRSSLNDLHSIYAAPQFRDPNNGDFSLLPASPCIGAGMPYIGGDKSFIGAVPPKAGSMPGDLDGNGKVDFADFAIFAQHWLEGVEL